MRRICWLAATLLVAASAVAQQPDVHKLAAQVDHRYNDLKTLQASFTESYRGNGLSRDESGTLYLKRPGKMRWDYTQPRPKLFVTDGKVAWFYVPGERQARRAPVKALDDLRSPLRYLLGHSKLEKEFRGLSLAPDVTPLEAGDVVLRGVPKGMEDTISQVLLEITPDRHIRAITIEEVDGTTTQFQLSEQKENVPVADQRFSFKPPAGVETVEAGDLTIGN